MADGTQTDLGERIDGVQVVIAAGATTSSVIVPKGLVPVAIETPAALTSTSITFRNCQTETGTFLPIYSDAGTAYTMTVDTATARHILIDPAKMVGISYLKIVMSNAEASERTLSIILRRID